MEMKMASRMVPRKIVSLSVRDQVYEQLKDLIVAGHFPEDYRFDLNRLSNELGVSRTPLSEAIQRLESEGLLVIKPRSGTFVNPLDEDEIREAFDLRKIFELGAADFILAKIDDNDIGAIKTIHDEMKTLLSSGDYQAILKDFIALDEKLHNRIIASSRHNLLIDHYGRVKTLLLVSRVRGKFVQKDSEATIKEHEAIISALENRDKREYKRAVEAHLKGAIDRLPKARRSGTRE